MKKAIVAKKTVAKKTVAKKTSTKTHKALMEFVRQYGKNQEYFDDRFYTVEGLPVDLDEKYLVGFPDKWVNRSPDGIDLHFGSVTTMQGIENNPQLNRWRGDVGNIVADFKSNRGLVRGSDIHTCIDRGINGYDIIYQDKRPNITDAQIKAYARKRRKKILIVNSQDVMVQLARFKRLLMVFKPKIIHTEVKVFNFEKAYAGQVDMGWEFTEPFVWEEGEVEVEAGRYIVDIKTSDHLDLVSAKEQTAAYAKAYEYMWGKDSITGTIVIHTNAARRKGIQGIKMIVTKKDEIEDDYDTFLKQRDLFVKRKDVNPKLFEIPVIISLSDDGIKKPRQRRKA